MAKNIGLRVTVVVQIGDPHGNPEMGMTHGKGMVTKKSMSHGTKWRNGTISINL